MKSVMDISDFDLDEDFLDDVGLTSLPDSEKSDMLTYLKEEMSVHVGQVLMRQLSVSQVTTFTELVKQNNPTTVVGFLRQHLPNYQEIVTREIAVFKDSVKSEAPDLLRRYRSTGLV